MTTPSIISKNQSGSQQDLNNVEGYDYNANIYTNQKVIVNDTDTLITKYRGTLSYSIISGISSVTFTKNGETCILPIIVNKSDIIISTPTKSDTELNVIKYVINPDLIENDVNTLIDEVSDINDNISTITEDVNTVEEDITTINTNITTINTNVSNINTDITNIEEDITTQESNISTLISDNNTNKSNISSLTSNLATTNSNLATTNSNLSTTNSNLSTAQSNIVTAQSNISTLQTSDSYNSKVTRVTLSIAQLTDSLNNGTYFEILPARSDGKSYLIEKIGIKSGSGDGSSDMYFILQDPSGYSGEFRRLITNNLFSGTARIIYFNPINEYYDEFSNNVAVANTAIRFRLYNNSASITSALTFIFVYRLLDF